MYLFSIYISNTSNPTENIAYSIPMYPNYYLFPLSCAITRNVWRIWLNIYLSLFFFFFDYLVSTYLGRGRQHLKTLLTCTNSLMKLPITCTRRGLISHHFVTVSAITDPIKIKLSQSRFKLASGLQVNHRTCWSKSQIHSRGQIS